jgi:phage FluMu protein Com
MPARPVVREWRCLGCRRLLARLDLVGGGRVEVKCERCGRLNRIEYHPRSIPPTDR